MFNPATGKESAASRMLQSDLVKRSKPAERLRYLARHDACERARSCARQPLVRERADSFRACSRRSKASRWWKQKARRSPQLKSSSVAEEGFRVTPIVPSRASPAIRQWCSKIPLASGRVYAMEFPINQVVRKGVQRSPRCSMLVKARGNARRTLRADPRFEDAACRPACGLVYEILQRFRVI